ncbi:hypothetical protein Tco_1359385 [Tanacetum coccineum]
MQGDEGLAAGVEGPDTDDKSHGLDDESRGLDDEGHSVESNGLGLEEDEEAVPEGQQQAALVMGTAVNAPLKLGYRALRRRELALEEDHVYSTFKVRQGSGSAPESKRPERVSVFRQPILTTWTDLKDGMTSDSLPISPSPSVVPSPISSPLILLTVPSPVATPATTETEGFLTELGAQVKMDIGELFTRSRVVRDEIFSQRYRFRSLEYEQERVAMTFGAIWRPVLALESWAGQTDAHKTALWHAISDMQGENQEFGVLQPTRERRRNLE